ncbi:MAG TPA: SDR family oxidoreductase [Ilumatobacteraceae bacterium]
MSGPVAIITGGSRGFGRALAEDLAHSGWSVVIDARGSEALTATTAGLNGVIAIAGDINDAAHRAALIRAARDLGPLTLLVNNASILGPSPQPHLADYPLSVLSDVYAANVIAPLGLVQAAIGDLHANDGTVVNITSDAGTEAYEGWGGYGSSKAALDHWSRVLAAEEPALRVYSFDPGDMRTQMHQDAFPGEDISDRPSPESVVPALRRLLEASPPSGRYTAAELAGTL